MDSELKMKDKKPSLDEMRSLRFKGNNNTVRLNKDYLHPDNESGIFIFFYEFQRSENNNEVRLISRLIPEQHFESSKIKEKLKIWIP